jgi:AraC family transcriptional regulator of arabinose operon
MLPTVESLDDSAMPPQPYGQLTILSPGGLVLAGHFRKEADYATRRAYGTDDWLLIITLYGAGRLSGITAEPGDVIAIRPGTAHDYGTDPAVGRWELAWAHLLIPDYFLDLVDWPEVAPGHLRRRIADHELLGRAAAAIDEAERWSRSSAPFDQRLALNAVERALLWCAVASGGPEPVNRDPVIRQVCERILADLADPPDLEALAALVGLSPSRLAHRFTAVVGVSPGVWRERHQLRWACQLLDATDHTVAAVASAVGFTDPFYFSKRFRRFSGRTPSSWRCRSAPAQAPPERGGSAPIGVASDPGLPEQPRT